VSGFDPGHPRGQRFAPIGALLASRAPAPGTSGQGRIVDLELGSVVLRVGANPITDAAGQPLGTVVQWLDRTQEAATEAEVQSVVQRAIDGDLTARVAEAGKEGFFKTLTHGTNRLVDNMTEIVRTMSEAAGEVRARAEDISRGNAALLDRTDAQAHSLRETASSMERMTGTVKSNADHAVHASDIAIATRSDAERGGSVVQSAVTAMSEINASSSKIANIIGVIDEIAFQTNLLALNAAVEAARAGEQGRGFAVVASEVRSLASRSAEAAREIKALIADSLRRVAEGTTLVGESGVVLGKIVAGVKEVSDVIGEIANAGHEQKTGIEQVNRAVISMEKTTENNIALVHDAAAAADALSRQAETLTALMDRYRTSDADGGARSASAARGSDDTPPRHLRRA
jgi:methyl-accepting chemotaxis protein